MIATISAFATCMHTSVRPLGPQPNFSSAISTMKTQDSIQRISWVPGDARSSSRRRASESRQRRCREDQLNSHGRRARFGINLYGAVPREKFFDVRAGAQRNILRRVFCASPYSLIQPGTLVIGAPVHTKASRSNQSWLFVVISRPASNNADRAWCQIDRSRP
jgi:hypothetical protein